MKTNLRGFACVVCLSSCRIRTTFCDRLPDRADNCIVLDYAIINCRGTCGLSGALGGPFQPATIQVVARPRGSRILATFARPYGHKRERDSARGVQLCRRLDQSDRESTICSPLWDRREHAFDLRW
ncbi:hypothetical protein B0T24DRAFT_606357 [Lasiosphaeria ovina]|uniref:Uncharacterized protein n=1 Tax=Lasiosphaeria ovina TaxID=92902 RepID=A0AAE0TY75_9PEZI|nr:hypothetical protein B0T24DRAFT_606357 [Lasiosphaeria ovina]